MIKLVVTNDNLFNVGCFILLAVSFAQILAPLRGFLGIIIVSSCFGVGGLYLGLSVDIQESEGQQEEEKEASES